MDWADERVRRFRLGMIRYNGTKWVTDGEAAQALRDVQRETAEECIIACESHYFTPTEAMSETCRVCKMNFRHPIHLRVKESTYRRVKAIRERFLKEKP